MLLPGTRLTKTLLRKALGRSLATMRGGEGARVRDASGGRTVSAAPFRMRWPQFLWIEITGSTLDTTNRWEYDWIEVTKTSVGYGGWVAVTDGRNSTGQGVAFNGFEDENSGTGVEGNGIDIDGADFPAGFSMQPIADGVKVPAWEIPLPDGNVEVWFAAPNSVDGTCDVA